ncbi:hypothetical protein NL676_039294 [Syzygium grande]|nr:hypothetical protein NL676_039294 [Syzygium grande]
MAWCLANLMKIEIKECGQMEGVIAEDEGPRNTVEKITFPELSVMKLECLPNLTSFLLGNNHALDCPELGSLTITHCPKMRSLTSQSSTEIDNGTPSLFTPQVQFPRLRGIVLSHMNNLSKIWIDGPPETLAFKNLLSLEVHNCGDNGTKSTPWTHGLQFSAWINQFPDDACWLEIQTIGLDVATRGGRWTQGRQQIREATGSGVGRESQ